MMVQMRNHAERHDGSPAARPVTCEEFQKQMPELLGEDIREHEHLKTCARCAALLEELEYIARIASDLLLPVYEPRETVWQKIHASLRNPANETVTANGHLARSPLDALDYRGHLGSNSKS
jgi:hypothetical protein